ncbi:hypothetical protein GLOIN_2v1786555 [Rhizophagus irregularis DAOM 181602=DAOM 197198]|nr:hypothetical protein GLOIN_2v1786555 [Rhizophagus irregularis DAOM 181602=DAOM 197198]
MDAAMEQTIGFQGRILRWGTSNDSKALCHRCGKLGCAPTSCPLNQRRGRSRTRDPVATLKERFNIGQRPAHQKTPRNNSWSRSRSKSRDRSASAQRSPSNSNRSNNNNNNNNSTKPSSSGSVNSSSAAHGHIPSNNRKGKDRSVSFSASARVPLPDPTTPNALEAALKILNVLQTLQHDVARVESRISSLELNNQRLSAIEAHLGINPPSAPVVNSEPDRIEEDPPETTGTLIQHPNAPLSSEHESLFTTLNSSPIPNSFNISSFNVNGLRHNSQVKFEQISNFFNLKHISFGGIVDTHLSPKQIHFLSKRLPNYTVFSSDIDKTKQVKSTGGVSLFIEKSLASHVQDFVSHSSRILSVDLYFKGNVKLHIFVIYIPPISDSKLRSETIDLLLQLLVQTKQQNFYHVICGDFNMHLDIYYPIYFNRPAIASQRAYRLLYHLLSHGYEETIPVNASTSLGTFHRDDQVTRIDYVWSCPMLKCFALTSYIFDAQDTCSSDHNPIITYFDDSLLAASIKVARAKQLQRRTCRIFKFDSVTTQQWESFSVYTDSLCDVPPSTFSTWHINQQCEYLHSRIVKAANASLPSVTPSFAFDTLIAQISYSYFNRYEHVWSIHFIRLQKILHLYKKVIPSPPILPTSLTTCRQDGFNSLLESLKTISSALYGLLLLKEKDFQDSSIRAKLDDRDNNFEFDISSFINSALSRTRRRITLDRVFIDHSTQPKLLTDLHDIDAAVINHFQNSVPIKSSPPDNISALPEKWSSAYRPIDDVNSSIYDSLLDPPTLEECIWVQTLLLWF